MNSVDEITRLIYRYCELIDSGDLDAYCAQFEHGSMGGRPKGDTASLRKWIDENMVFYDGSPRTKHVTTNLVIDVDEEADSASARSYVTVFHAAPGYPLAVVGCAEYRDRFDRVDGVWRWAERTVHNALAGESSRHTRADREADSLSS